MKIAVDTNVLVRVFTNDDEVQNRIANAALSDATAVVITLPMLCELAWVLSRGYGCSAGEVAKIMRVLLSSENAVIDGPAVEAGLTMLDAGGDFADGVIAFEGRRMGAETFVSFDRKAVGLLAAQGEAARLLA